MNISKIMTTNIVTVHMDDDLAKVRDIFARQNFHQLLVTATVNKKRKLVGVISDRDLFKALSPNLGTAAETDKDQQTLKKKVHQVMSRSPKTLTREARIYDAIQLFNDDQVSCIPIVDQDHNPVGIISWRDILKALGQALRTQ